MKQPFNINETITEISDNVYLYDKNFVFSGEEFCVFEGEGNDSEPEVFIARELFNTKTNHKNCNLLARTGFITDEGVDEITKAFKMANKEANLKA